MKNGYFCQNSRLFRNLAFVLSDAITKVASKVTKSYDVVSMFPVICSSIHLPLQAWYLAKSTFSRFLDAFISFTILSSYIFASKFRVFDQKHRKWSNDQSPSNNTFSPHKYDFYGQVLFRECVSHDAISQLNISVSKTLYFGMKIKQHLKNYLNLDKNSFERLNNNVSHRLP